VHVIKSIASIRLVSISLNPEEEPNESATFEQLVECPPPIPR
jgi:hypothetical protein